MGLDFNVLDQGRGFVSTRRVRVELQNQPMKSNWKLKLDGRLKLIRKKLFVGNVKWTYSEGKLGLVSK